MGKENLYLALFYVLWDIFNFSLIFCIALLEILQIQQINCNVTSQRFVLLIYPKILELLSWRVMNRLLLLIKIWFKSKWFAELFCKVSLRKRCPYLKFFWFVFSRIRTEYGRILWKNTEQKNSEYRHFALELNERRVVVAVL